MTSLLHVKVTTGARTERIEPQTDGSLKVWLKAAPVKGEANKALIKIIADYYYVPPSLVRIAHGHTSRNKIISIDK